MKDRMARVLAIVALVFMLIFIVALTLTLIDYTMLNGAIGFVALGTGVFAIMIFIALKADGRGFSITKMNNEIEMAKIEKELAEKQAAEKAKAEQSKQAGEQEEQDQQATEDQEENKAEQTAEEKTE